MGEYEAASSEVEERLIRMWEELLGIEGIGIRDNFFRVGGHSLMATQVVSRIREEYGIEIGLREMFEGPTVGELGERIEEGRRGGERVEEGRIGRASREEEIAAVVRAAAAVVFGSVGAGQRVLQHTGGGEADGRAGRGGVGEDVQRDGEATRGAEDEDRNNRRQACAGDLGTRSDEDRDRRYKPSARSRAREQARASSNRRSTKSIRPIGRAVDKSEIDKDKGR